ncbi:MAG: autorepressor SdpR family transcription factor [Ignavibacteria bacterium]|nr:autorepressor SdpR family transcription factor [Ignavibacteria bacterium]
MKTLNIVFKALGDPSRMEILRLLREKDMSPSEILQHKDSSQPTLSHHLDILKRANLVDCERRGQFIHYSFNMSVFEMAMEYLMKFTKRR